eukprot:11865895-Alexandrium_andersonii.AAC.1
MTGLPRRCAATTAVGPDKSVTASSATAQNTANDCVEQVLLSAIACAPVLLPGTSITTHRKHLLRGFWGAAAPPERSAMNLQTLQNA